MKLNSENHSRGPLEDALRKLQQIVVDGLQHGFFECHIEGEITTGQKRRLVIRAGKSYRFLIEVEELKANGAGNRVTTPVSGASSRNSDVATTTGVIPG